ncbi:MAG: hypothetical protein H6821_15925 [Planctomycetaceae bacterium]|nr:hypothetical protein [Planctomycetales bacterium]MCB9875660.1 hypothetical protein [Planctomycetaceae bacterium]
MTGRFDPYHKWLGIPPREQPANYYRLLGLDLFEDDGDAIECAADRLMKYVRDTATAEQREDAKRVFTELAAAKRCLLVVEQKQAYDAGLRAGQAAMQPPTYDQSTRHVEPSATVHVTPVVSKTQASKSHRTHAKRTSVQLIAVASTICLIGFCICGVVFLRGNSEPTNQIAETSEDLETSEILKPSEAPSRGSPIPVTTTTEFELQKEDAEVLAPIPPEPIPPDPVVESSLPDFVVQEVASTAVTKLEESAEIPSKRSVPEIESEPLAQTTVKSASSANLTVERGGFLREVWTNVTGNKVEDIVNHIIEHPEPDQTETIDRFEPPEDFDDQYGQRLRGYLHPPTTGSYEFSIRANAEGWLFVSTDALSENKRQVESGTKIGFEAGKVYYVEAFHKESTGRDYLSVGWTLPDGTQENPIPGERLSVHYRIAPRHETEFVALTPLAAESTAGTELNTLDGGVILASGAANAEEIYRLQFESAVETITAIRLEAISHEELPASGPGRGIGGRFALGEVSATTIGNDPSEESRPLNFASAVDESGHDLSRLIDGDSNTFWRGSGRGKEVFATLIVQDPEPFTSISILQIELKQRESLGCLRVLATSAPSPLSLSGTSDGESKSGDLYSLFVNLGGDDFVAPDGVRWRASKLFDNETFGHEGGRGVSEDLIANRVQGSAQRGIAAFRAMVPEGTYDVTLYFCEYWSTTPSSRRFAIAAEQRVVAANFDLFQAAGGIARPLVYPVRNVAVTDGRLDIQFRGASEGASAILNAISIQQVR